ncbi:MAG: SpoIID/LytB domain-containing protein, partial [Evtepia sp.]
MKRFLIHITVLMSLITILLIGSAQAADTDMIRVGLFYGDAALSSAHLENAEGSGYRFGYSNAKGSFTELGNTSETQIAMLKTQNQYLSKDLYTIDAGSGGVVIGCYHIQLSEKYATFQEAKSAADQITNAFPAWISGMYCVRIGAYATSDLATAALSEFPSGSVVGTSGNGISVVKTKTTRILFQFDGTSDQIFTVKPVGNNPKTWFKGYRYYGDFMYKRMDGGNLTVINYVSLENYVKGVLPYEMSASWPVEALKAQAVCARNYARLVGTKHAKDGFDVCNTIDCQVYCGLNKASDNSDRAV